MQWIEKISCLRVRRMTTSKNYSQYTKNEWTPAMTNDLTIKGSTYGVKVLDADYTQITETIFNLQSGVFSNIANKTVNPSSLRYVIVVLYLRVLFCKTKILETVKDTDKGSYITGFTQNAMELLNQLPTYLNSTITNDTAPTQKPLTFPIKGGMDTAKIYNAQGLIQEMSAFNRGDSVSPVMNFPSPFSGSAQGNTLGVMDSLPQAAVTALMPPLVGGKKKK